MAQCHRLATTEVVAESAAEQPGSLSGRPVSSREEHVSAMTTHKSWCRHSEARPLPSDGLHRCAGPCALPSDGLRRCAGSRFIALTNDPRCV